MSRRPPKVFSKPKSSVPMDILSRDGRQMDQNQIGDHISKEASQVLPDTGYLHPQNGEINRQFDSGVADLDSSQIDMDMNSAAMKMRTPGYDYADYNGEGHQYEELPSASLNLSHKLSQETLSSRSEHPSSANTSDPFSDGDDASMFGRRGEKDPRKRVNPLYDAIAKSIPPSSSKIALVSRESLPQRQRHNRGLCFVCVFSVIMAAGAIAISLYMLLEQSKNIQLKQDQFAAVVSDLEAKYAKLQNKYSNLEQFLDSSANMSVTTALLQKINEQKADMQQLSSQVSIMNSSVTESLNTVQANLATTDDVISFNQQTVNAIYINITEKMLVENGEFQAQILNVTKMQGPTGPRGMPGVGNLSQCYYEKKSSSRQASDTNAATTIWWPTPTDLQTVVIMGVTCSVVGGTIHTLNSTELTVGVFNYRCECYGTFNNIKDRDCYMHMWLCPKYS